MEKMAVSCVRLSRTSQRVGKKQCEGAHAQGMWFSNMQADTGSNVDLEQTLVNLVEQQLGIGQDWHNSESGRKRGQ